MSQELVMVSTITSGTYSQERPQFAKFLNHWSDQNKFLWSECLPSAWTSPSLLCTFLQLWTTPPVTWSPSATSASYNILSSCWTSSSTSSTSAEADQGLWKVILIYYSSQGNPTWLNNKVSFQWPCKSFWSLHDIPQQMLAQLSWNCKFKFPFFSALYWTDFSFIEAQWMIMWMLDHNNKCC